MSAETRTECVIYLRVSTKKQLKDDPELKAQEDLCREGALRNDLEVARVFRDLGRSGTLGQDGRPGFKAMREFCIKNHKRIRAVIVGETSRLARNVPAAREVRNALKEYRIIIVPPNVLIGPGVDLDAVHKALIKDDNAAEEFSTKLSTDTTTRMKAMAEKGRWQHQPPVGYTTCTDKSLPSLRVDSARAAFVQQAFREVAAGKPPREVWENLVRRGFTAQHGKQMTFWRFTSTLHQKAYWGWLVWTGARDFHDPVIVSRKGDWEPLISQELFEQVQDVLSREKSGKREYTFERADAPLKGIMRCGLCGGLMTSESAKNGQRKMYLYYRCHYGCKPKEPRIAVAKAHQFFSDTIRTLRMPAAHLESIRTRIEGTHAERTREAEKAAAEVQQALAGVTARISKLLDLLLDGMIAQTDYDLKHVELLREKNRLEGESKPCASGADASLLQDLDTARGMLLNFPRLWGTLDLQGQLKLGRLIFPEGLHFDGKNFRTPVTHCIFNGLQSKKAGKSKMASPTRFELVSPP